MKRGRMTRRAGKAPVPTKSPADRLAEPTGKSRVAGAARSGGPPLPRPPDTIDALDGSPELRQWFADWLIKQARRRAIYGKSLGRLTASARSQACARMDAAMRRLARRLPRPSTADQLAAVDAVARKHGLTVKRADALFELEYYLKRNGDRPDNAAASKASLVCNYHALKQHSFARKLIAVGEKHYPGLDAIRLRLALETVLSELTTSRGSYGRTARFRNHRRALSAAVRRLCLPPGDPKDLADLIMGVLRDWPRVPAGLDFDLKAHFDADERRAIVREHLRTGPDHFGTRTRDMRRVLRAILLRERLRTPLLLLLRDADLRRDRGANLRKALVALFDLVREPKNVERFRRLLRVNLPWMLQKLPRELRELLLATMGRHDPDSRARALTSEEQFLVFDAYHQIHAPQTSEKATASLKSSLREARRQVRGEFGID